MRTRHEDQAGIGLKNNSIFNACFDGVKALIAITPNLDASYDSLRSYFDLAFKPMALACDVITGPMGR